MVGVTVDVVVTVGVIELVGVVVGVSIGVSLGVGWIGASHTAKSKILPYSLIWTE